MSKDKTEITLDYSFGKDPTDGSVVTMNIRNTGIDLDNEKHRRFMEILLNVAATQMYAHAHDIDHRNIISKNKLPPKHSN